jgi:plasmid stabilization system protein ParE
MPVVVTPEAMADLRRIRDYIGQDNPRAASRVAVQLIAACDRLEYLPERGRPGLVAGTRELASFWP